MTLQPQIPLFDVRLDEDAVEAVADTLRSGWLTMGPRTKDFEDAYAERLGVRHAVAVSSCTASLHLAYLAAGVGPGDEVIVPAITFVASAAAVRHCGATPVLADVTGPHDLGVDPDDLERLIGERTKAVCVVHYAGYPAQVGRLREICERNGVALIEDCAHNPDLAPTGLAGCYSFFSNKVLSCGEGGLLATDYGAVADIARSLRSHAMTSGTWERHRGRPAGYDVMDLGFNYRMDEPRAALLHARLAGLSDDIERRRALVRRYRSELANTQGLTLPYADEEVGRSSCYVMPAVLEDSSLRDELRTRLMERHRVQTSVLYPAIHEFTAYRGASDRPLPQSEHVARAQITLPLFPHLAEADQDRVVAGVRNELADLQRSGAALSALP